MKFARLSYFVAVALTAVILTGGCGGAAPQVRVIGVTDTRSPTPDGRTLVVFMEVVNTTSREIELSRMRYRISAETLFDGEGEVRLSQSVAADSATVVQVPLQLRQFRGGVEPGDAPVGYSLRGKLYATSERIERSWNVSADGVLSSDALAGVRRGPVIRMRIADGD